MKMTAVEKRVKEAKYQSKPDATVVLYDADGRWILEMYCPLSGSIQVGSKRIFFEDVVPVD